MNYPQVFLRGLYEKSDKKKASKCFKDIYNKTFFNFPEKSSKHMRYANSLESLDSVSSSIQQARAYRWISEQLIKHILFTPRFQKKFVWKLA